MPRGKHHPPRPKPANSEGFLIANDLKKERGWTDTQIKQFLPSPDKTARNPFSRKAPPMKLYAKERVEAIEATPDYIRAREASRARQLAARGRALEKKREAVAVAEGLPLRISSTASLAEVKERSLRHYNSRPQGKRKPATLASPPSLLNRLAVNYLRHEQTSYEDELKAFKGVVGVGEAYLIVRNRILDLIAQAYPALKSECDRQKFEEVEMPDGVAL